MLPKSTIPDKDCYVGSERLLYDDIANHWKQSFPLTENPFTSGGYKYCRYNSSKNTFFTSVRQQAKLGYYCDPKIASLVGEISVRNPQLEPKTIIDYLKKRSHEEFKTLIEKHGLILSKPFAESTQMNGTENREQSDINEDSKMLVKNETSDMIEQKEPIVSELQEEHHTKEESSIDASVGALFAYDGPKEPIENKTSGPVISANSHESKKSLVNKLLHKYMLTDCPSSRIDYDTIRKEFREKYPLMKYESKGDRSSEFHNVSLINRRSYTANNNGEYLGRFCDARVAALAVSINREDGINDPKRIKSMISANVIVHDNVETKDSIDHKNLIKTLLGNDNLKVKQIHHKVSTMVTYSPRDPHFQALCKELKSKIETLQLSIMDLERIRNVSKDGWKYVNINRKSFEVKFAKFIERGITVQFLGGAFPNHKAAILASAMLVKALYSEEYSKKMGFPDIPRTPCDVDWVAIHTHMKKDKDAALKIRELYRKIIVLNITSLFSSEMSKE
jgi:hypothetical protein